MFCCVSTNVELVQPLFAEPLLCYLRFIAQIELGEGSDSIALRLNIIELSHAVDRSRSRERGNCGLARGGGIVE